MFYILKSVTLLDYVGPFMYPIHYRHFNWITSMYLSPFVSSNVGDLSHHTKRGVRYLILSPAVESLNVVCQVVIVLLSLVIE